MIENLGNVFGNEKPDEAASIEQENPAIDPAVSEGENSGENSTDETDSPVQNFESEPGNAADFEMTQDQHEPVSKIVVRRVRMEPADVIPPAPKNKGFLYSLLDTIRFVSLGLVIGILLVVFVVQRNDVYGPSMEPNLHERDAVFVEMISSYFTNPKRGDIVTINATGLPAYAKKEKIIKRVVGLPGETVTIKDGKVYINDLILEEPYLPADLPTYINDNGIADGYDSITLGTDEYYLMGDNRGASLDSRVLGPIPSSRIKARVIAKIFPFDEMGLL